MSPQSKREKLLALKELSALEPEKALAVLRTRSLDPDAKAFWNQLGQQINTLELGLPEVRLLGGCTLDYLAPQFSADLMARNLPFRVSVGGYDQILQDLQRQTEPYAVIVPWRKCIQDVESELTLCRSIWSIAQQKNIRLVQVSYDWVERGGSGRQGTQIESVRTLNSYLRAELPRGNYFLDLTVLSGHIGRSRFYDNRSYYWTKQPFSPEGLNSLSHALTAGLMAVVTGPKKVLVVDLDNTLWGGEVGERGRDGIVLTGPEGESFLAFQRYLKSLKDQGVLLAIASKNESKVALEALAEHPLMLLRPDDFVATEIHWEPKSKSLERIAKLLRLGIDSFVFFDDNPRERAEVEKLLPGVAVVATKADPVDYVSELQAGLYFESIEVTSVDSSRTQQYQEEAKRSEARETVQDYFDYLEMKATIRPVDEATMSRAVQLLARTNQFNVTTQRHSPDKLESFAQTDGAYLRTLKLVDRFGDLGIISVLIAVPEDEATLTIDSWVMSCRALQRSVEHYFCNHLVSYALELGFSRIVGRYLATAKNKPVEKLYEGLGFTPTQDGRFELMLDDFSPLPTHVR